MASLEIRAAVVGYFDDGTNKGTVIFNTVDPAVDPIGYQTKNHWQPKSAISLLPEDTIIKNQSEYEVESGVAQTGLSCTILKDGTVSFNNNNCTFWGYGMELKLAEIDGEEGKYLDQYMIISSAEKVVQTQYDLNDGDPIPLTVKDGFTRAKVQFGNASDRLGVFVSKETNPEVSKVGVLAVTLIHQPLIDKEIKIDLGALIPIKTIVNGLLAHYEITSGVWNEAIDAIGGEAFEALDLPIIYAEKVMA